MQEQLEDLQTQIWFFTQKTKEADYSFHQIAELEVIETKHIHEGGTPHLSTEG
jgi:hypothetical protein